MDKLIDISMSKLFQLAEYLTGLCAFPAEKPAEVPKPVVPTIRFSQEDKMVEGELFG